MGRAGGIKHGRCRQKDGDGCSHEKGGAEVRAREARVEIRGHEAKFVGETRGAGG